jgi:methyl-accepting chemotaxis protein WspA
MLRFQDVSIKAKMVVLVALSAAGVLGVVVLSQWMIYTFSINGPVYDRLIARAGAVSDFSPSPLFALDPYLTLRELITTRDPAEVKRLTELFRRQEEEWKERQAHWEQTLFEGPVKQALEREVYPTATEFFRLARDEYLPLVAKGDHADAEKVLTTRVQPAFEAHRRAVIHGVQIADETTQREQHQVAERLAFWRTVMTVGSVAAVVLITLVGGLLGRNIVRATAALLRRVEEMAGGASDLTARVAISSHDEVGQLASGINAVIGKIQAIVRRVREASVQLLSAAAQISAAARQQEGTMQALSSSTSEIAASVREISATSKELSATMNEVSDRAGNAASLASAGRARLGGTEEAMQRLVEATASVSAKLGVIREKADSINVVVTTITKVADQTNLLSINAAIEAEKAGEYGRGFLVVAREIRRLADQTAVATLDIENIVRLMQDAVSAGVMQMDKFSEEVRAAVARIGEINAQMGQNLEEVQALISRFQAVNEGVRNQAVGAEQINEAMAQVSAGAQQTRASLEEFNRAAAHLRGSVDAINQEVAQFTV